MLNTDIFSSKVCLQAQKNEAISTSKYESGKNHTPINSPRDYVIPKEIPADLQKTIAALKVAKPKHAKMRRRPKYPLHQHRFSHSDSVPHLDTPKDSFHILRKYYKYHRKHFWGM